MYGPRATQVARTLRALVPLGWQPTVVCLDPRRGGPHWRDGRDAPPLAGVDLIRVKSPEEWMIVRAAWKLMPSLREQPDSKWVWIGRAAAAVEAAAATTAFDGLVTFAQPWSDHLVGLRAHRATRLPWVAHFSDPWIDSPYWRGTAARRDAAAKMEADVVREATALVFVTAEAADLVMKKYPASLRSKAAVVPHGFEPAPPPRPGARDTAAKMRLVYTGRFYEGIRTPTVLLRCLAQLQVEQAIGDKLELTFVGPFVTGFADEARAFGVDAFVHFRSKVSRADAEAIAAGADALLVFDAPTDGPSPFLPSKLVDYLPLRKPIIGITPVKGASASLLKRLGCPVAAPDDELAIRAAIADMLKRWTQGRLGVGPDFDRVAAEYDISRTTATFSDVLARAFA